MKNLYKVFFSYFSLEKKVDMQTIFLHFLENQEKFLILKFFVFQQMLDLDMHFKCHNVLRTTYISLICNSEDNFAVNNSGNLAEFIFQ